MKTAVSIPDDLFRRADELARRLGKSRSEVYREALAEYVFRREPRSVTASLDALADELASQQDPWLPEVGRKMLARSEW
jgi:metal-responsive CopG/Arc/MetJ family transcriptional regulator